MWAGAGAASAALRRPLLVLVQRGGWVPWFLTQPRSQQRSVEAAQQRLPRLPQAARTRRSSKARSRASLINTPSNKFGGSVAARLVRIWLLRPPTVHQPNELSSSKASGLRCTHQYGSLSGRSRIKSRVVLVSYSTSLPLWHICGEPLTAGWCTRSDQIRQLLVAAIHLCVILCIDTTANGRTPQLASAEERCPRVVAAIHQRRSDGLGTRSSDRSRPAAT